MDSRQSMSMMGPPGYPHMPPMSSAVTGNKFRDTPYKCQFKRSPEMSCNYKMVKNELIKLNASNSER